VSAGTRTFQLGIANTVASIIVLVLSPVLGSISDASNAKKRFLIFFMFMGVLSTLGLYFVGQGNWFMALFIFVLGNIGFAGSNNFYDSLLVSVGKREDYDSISAFGFAIGYLGGGILLVVNFAMATWPQYFGFESSLHAARFAFVTVAVWWLLFTIPLLLNVKEPARVATGSIISNIGPGLRQLKNTFIEIRRLKVVAIFLLAYFLYIDGVDTIIKMANDFAISINLDPVKLIGAFLVTQFIGFPAAIIYGIIGRRVGIKKAILFGVLVYAGVTVYATQMNSVPEFYVLAIVIGLIQGGVQSLSRSFYARIIPAQKAGEFFGFYNMLGKFAAILGPLLVGMTAKITENPQLSILSLIILFVGGGLLLLRVDVEEGERMANEMNDNNH
jgi:UMF1 family MFS transporter